MLAEQNRQKLLSVVKQMEANSESPETIQRAVNLFKEKYDEPETTTPEDTTIWQKAEQLAGVIPNIPQQIAENPKQAGITGAKALGELGLYGAQAAGGMVLPEMAAAKFGLQGAAKLAPYLASGATTTPATQFGIEKIEGQTNPEAAKQAALAGAFDIGGSTIGSLAAKGIKKALPAFTNFATGIPKEAAENALNKEIADESMFAGKFTPKQTEKELGAKTINSLDNLKKEAGQEINSVKEQWRNMPAFEKTNAKAASNDASLKISDLLESRKFGKKYDLDLGTVQDLKQLSKDIKNTDNIGDFYTYIGDLDDKVSYDVSTGLKKATPRSEGALKEARGIIRDELGNLSPEYAKLADKYSEIATLHKSLRPLLKDENIAGSQIDRVLTKGLEKPEDNLRYAAELDRLNELMPEKHIDALKTNSIREQYENILPKTLTKHVSPLGIMALAGGSGYGMAKSPGSTAIGLSALLAAMSPKLHKKAIQAFNPNIATIGKPAAKQAFTRISDLLNNKGEQ
jgi:hypothetical protein